MKEKKREEKGCKRMKKKMKRTKGLQGDVNSAFIYP